MTNNTGKDGLAAPSFPITRDVSITVDWREMTQNILGFVKDTIAESLTTGNFLGGVGNLLAATKSISIESTIGEKAWTAAMLCFAWSVADLSSSSNMEDGSLQKLMADLLDRGRSIVDAGEQRAPIDFLERPTQLPLYQALRDEAIRRKSEFRSGTSETDDALSARFDATYDRAMFEVFLRRPEIFNSLVEASKAPAAASAQKQIDWIAYRQKLIYDFEVRPVFGQESTKLSLSQLYVPLRGYWRRDGVDSSDLTIGRNQAEIYEYGQLEETLDGWLDAADRSDVVRLIGGGPGSGKSTTLRALASRLAKRPEYRPLFIPLQHLSLDGDIREAVNLHFSERTDGEFRHKPLAREAFEDGPPFVLIFDGLDELARPGEAANEVVRLFTAKLVNLISALKGEGQKHLKVIVSGRMPAFQAASRYLTPPRAGCIEVHGYTGLPAHPKLPGFMQADQREIWWKQYAHLTGLPEGVPPAFSSDRLEGLTHEPLLCYLLVLSGFATSNWERAAENPNIIYRQLVNSIWDRGWGEGAVKRLGPGRNLTREDFNTLMQTIALAAWQGGDTRVASEAGFEAAIKLAGAENAWAAFKDDNGADVTNLAMNFYLKASEGGHRGFEFTHKSFGDYLAARAILDVAYELPLLIHRKVDHALTDWIAATSSGTLTDEILTFLRDEVRLRATGTGAIQNMDFVADTKLAFESFISTILMDGFPPPKNAETGRAIEAAHLNSEVMAWAVINALSLSLAFDGRDDRMIKVNWPEPRESFQILLRRITKSYVRENPALKCFSYVVAPESYMFGLAISEIDLRGAEMPSAVFSGSLMMGANLRGGNFRNAQFERAMLDGADLTEADFTESNLVDARLSGAELDGTIMTGAEISLITLAFSKLSEFERRGRVFIADRHRLRSEASDELSRTISSAYKLLPSLVEESRDRINSRPS